MNRGQPGRRAALLVPRVTADLEVNLTTIERMATTAAIAGAGLVLLPEAVLTGLSNNDDPAHDLPLGQPVPGPATDRLGAFARRHGLWLGFGLLERDGGHLYDSAVLLGPDGSITLTYRRNQPQWHAFDADPTVYRQGTDIGMVPTPFGRVGFLLCGDLFDDDIVARFRAQRPDLLLFPFARCFDDFSADQRRWDTEEMPEYAARVKLAGVPALMVNYLGDATSLPEDHSFGGAFYVSAAGEVLTGHPLGAEGTLLVDLPGA